MNVAEALIETWQDIGVRYVFGIPGEETLALVEALRHSDIELILTRHEQAAAFMAATYGRLTGKPALCLTTLGPGATNTLTAIAYAKLGQMPMILITGQKPIHEVKQGYFQMIDVVSMVSPISIASQRLVNPAAAPSMAMQMYHAALSNLGPTHIELPEDVASEEVPGDQTGISYPKEPCLYASDETLQWAADLITNATAPLLILGQGANQLHISDAASGFVRETGIPFVSTQMGKGVVDERLDLYLGTTSLTVNDFVHHIIQQSDLLIMVGHNHSEKPPFLACCGTQVILHIDDESAFFNEVYAPAHVVVGDIAHSMRKLSAILNPSQSWKFNLCTKAKRAFEVHEASLAESSGNTPYKAILQVRNATPEDGIVLLDNGMYKVWFARHYRTYLPNTLLLDNALATMGAGLPTAVAAAIIHPERRILAVCGDGGFMMNSQELETARRLGANLTVLILKDDAYGMIRWKQEGEGYADYAMTFGNPDFVALAESYGAHGIRIEQVGDLSHAIKNSFDSGGVHLIEMPVDYAENRLLNRLSEITKSFNQSQPDCKGNA